MSQFKVYDIFTNSSNEEIYRIPLGDAPTLEEAKALQSKSDVDADGLIIVEETQELWAGKDF